MNTDKYSRNVSMQCPTCGNTEFAFEQDDAGEISLIRCPSCNREITKDELIRENEENINIHAEEMGNEIKKDFAGELKNRLQNAFKGSKNIRIK